MTNSRKSRDPWSGLTTEAINPRSRNLDSMSPEQIVRLIHSEDHRAIKSIAPSVKTIATVARKFSKVIVGGGRVVYVGAGTSGRLGVIDAAELVPTFGLPRTGKGSTLGIIAGGPDAMLRSIEGAEDDERAGAKAGREAGTGDMLIGISASSLAPFVRASLREAKRRGAVTVLVTMNRIRKPDFVDHLISVIVGPEVVSGSTRMKAGLATKSVLHNISTTAMVIAGKVYGNRMVDLKTWCSKLEARGTRLISAIGEVSPESAARILEESTGDVKAGIVMARLGIGKEEAQKALAKSNGSLRKALCLP